MRLTWVPGGCWKPRGVRVIRPVCFMVIPRCSDRYVARVLSQTTAYRQPVVLGYDTLVCHQTSPLEGRITTKTLRAAGLVLRP